MLLCHLVLSFGMWTLDLRALRCVDRLYVVYPVYLFFQFLGDLVLGVVHYSHVNLIDDLLRNLLSSRFWRLHLVLRNYP